MPTEGSTTDTTAPAPVKYTVTAAYTLLPTCTGVSPSTSIIINAVPAAPTITVAP
jgi:hypothetical protein